MTENRKPFGLSLSCKIAAEAIRESVAPVSIILYNLFALQKDTVFPKNLDKHYFATLKRNPTDVEKRVISKILEDLRGPHVNTSDLLESYVKQDWVVKKAPVAPVQNKPKNNINNPKNKVFKGNNGIKGGKNATKNVKKEVVPPVVIVKKTKLI